MLSIRRGNFQGKVNCGGRVFSKQTMTLGIKMTGIKSHIHLLRSCRMWRLCPQPVRRSLYLHVGTDWIMLHVNRKSLQPQVLWWELRWGKVGKSRVESAAAPRSSTLRCSAMENRMTAFLSVSFPDLWVGANWSALAPAAVEQAKLPEADVSDTGRTPWCRKCRAVHHSKSQWTGSTGRAYSSIRTPHSHSADEGLKEKIGKGKKKMLAKRG